MMEAPIPANEQDRLAALCRYDVLDTEPERAFDDIVSLAAHISGAPIALVSLVDRDRQWFKASLGLDVAETDRSVSFCGHAIHGDDLFVVENATTDLRFFDNPLVTGVPHVRFYAGAPLITSDGFALGTLCVIDQVPRSLTEPQRDALLALGRQVVAQLELRMQASQIQSAHMELVAACEVKKKFLENINHELRTPIAAIMGSAESLPDTHNENERAWFTDRIVHHAEELLSLVEKILEVTQIDSGRITVSKESLGLDAIARYIRLKHQPAAEGKALDLLIRMGDNLPSAIESDPARVHQILDVLIGNSIKYTDRGSVSVDFVVDDRGDLMIAVADTGIGISSEDLPKVFDRFVRLGDESARLRGGSGLGLHLATELAHTLGGRIEASSQLAKGSRFQLILPLEPRIIPKFTNQ